MDMVKHTEVLVMTMVFLVKEATVAMMMSHMAVVDMDQVLLFL